MADITEFTGKVFPTDIMKILRQMPDKSVDMIYGDPDYNVGIKYNDHSYTVGFEEYIDWYIDLVRESLRVLKDDGNMFLINYPKQNAYLRVKYLDGACYDVQDYAWVYNSNIGHSPRRFTTAHRSILHVRKTEENRFYKDQVAVPYQNPTDRRIRKNIEMGSKGRMPYSWFYFDLVKNVSSEKTLHACQIPQKMAEMFILASTQADDVVLVLFGGSGSELEVCQRLNRRYISAEIDPEYHQMILERLSSGVIDERYKLNGGKKKQSVGVQQHAMLEGREGYS